MNQYGEETVAALSTPVGTGGIAVIRMSGPDALSIADRIFQSSRRKRIAETESHKALYGWIVDMDGKRIDEVLALGMHAPHTFTGEDTVEISCHGGMYICRRILEALIQAGARMAEPGEFSKRAFLNGRIDLSEAEAVMDLISSKNDLALKSSVKQLQGAISKKIKEIRKKIIYEIAFIESALDDPEHISLEEYPEKLLIIVDNLIEDVNKLLSTAENGKMIKEGINTVIVGKPNAGKSSLLNLLVGEEKAIVTEIAGTTRDILEEDIRISGISLHIIDTAGIRRAEDIVEKIGVEKAKQQVMEADLIIYVVDSSVPLDENDFDIIEMIQDKKCIILFNKTDLESLVSVENLKKRTGKDTVIIKTSTKENTGINDFENAVKEMFFHGEISLNDEVMITNMRHKEALQETLESLKQVKKSIKMQMPEDFYSIDLMSAYSSLGKIIGEEVEEDLVNEIFSKFCMGK